MFGIDGTHRRGSIVGRRLRRGALAAAGTVLLTGGLLGAASQPAFATTAAPAQAAVGVVTCNGMTAAQASAAGYVVHDHSASPFGVVTVGGPGRDWIVGSRFIDTLDGQGDDDSICGRDGDDDIRGGTGNDSMFGGLGADHISGDGGERDEGIGGGADPAADDCTVTTERQVNC